LEEIYGTAEAAPSFAADADSVRQVLEPGTQPSARLLPPAPSEADKIFSQNDGQAAEEDRPTWRKPNKMPPQYPEQCDPQSHGQRKSAIIDK
jgi:hypothetical protein